MTKRFTLFTLLTILLSLTLTTTYAASPITAHIQGLPQRTVSVPLAFAGEAAQITSLAFSIDYDESCLDLSPADENGDEIPDAITLNLPVGFNASVQIDSADTNQDGLPELTLPANVQGSATYDAATSQLQFFIADIFMPVTALSDTTLATLTLTVNESARTATSDIRIIEASLGSEDGLSLRGKTTDSQVEINHVPTAVTLANTQADSASPIALTIVLLIAAIFSTFVLIKRPR